jgi:hypothetical protein
MPKLYEYAYVKTNYSRDKCIGAAKAKQNHVMLLDITNIM